MFDPVTLRDVPVPVLRTLAQAISKRYLPVVIDGPEGLADEAARLQLAYEAGQASVARDIVATIRKAEERNGSKR